MLAICAEVKFSCAWLNSTIEPEPQIVAGLRQVQRQLRLIQQLLGQASRSYAVVAFS